MQISCSNFHYIPPMKKSRVRPLSVVEIKLSGVCDVVIYRSLIVRGKICCSSVSSNRAFVQ